MEYNTLVSLSIVRRYISPLFWYESAKDLWGPRAERCWRSRWCCSGQSLFFVVVVDRPTASVDLLAVSVVRGLVAGELRLSSAPPDNRDISFLRMFATLPFAAMTPSNQPTVTTTTNNK